MVLIVYLVEDIAFGCGPSHAFQWKERDSKQIYNIYIIYIHFSLNLQLIGIGVIVVSSLALDDDVIDSNGRDIYILFIVIGSVVFLISFFGCCGAIKENICLTWTVSGILH